MLHLISLKLYYVKTSFFFFIPSVKGVFPSSQKFQQNLFIALTRRQQKLAARGNIVCTKFKIL